MEPTLFAAELEKFHPYQQRFASSVHQEVVLQEVTSMWEGLKDIAGQGAGFFWDKRERRKKDTVRRFKFLRTRDGYMEVRDGLAYVFYTYMSRYVYMFSN